MEEKNELVVTSPKGGKLNKRWNPKEWRPEYEAMVALSCTGLPQGVIAKRFGYSEAWLSSILNSEMGRAVKNLIIQKSREGVINSIPEKIREIQGLAADRMLSVMRNEKLFTQSPLGIFDRSALLLKNTGLLGTPEETSKNVHVQSSVVHNTLIINSTDAENVREGLKKADEVKRLHSGTG